MQLHHPLSQLMAEAWQPFELCAVVGVELPGYAQADGVNLVVEVGAHC
jgi:hypothetical protein